MTRRKPFPLPPRGLRAGLLCFSALCASLIAAPAMAQVSMPPPPLTYAQGTACGFTNATVDQVNSILSPPYGFQAVQDTRAIPGVLPTYLPGGEAQLSGSNGGANVGVLENALYFTAANAAMACEHWNSGMLVQLPWGQTYSQFVNNQTCTAGSTPCELQGNLATYDITIYAVGALLYPGYAPNLGGDMSGFMWGANRSWNNTAVTSSQCMDDTTFYPANLKQHNDATSLPGWDGNPNGYLDPQGATRCAPIVNGGIPDASHFLRRFNYIERADNSQTGPNCSNPPTGALPITGVDTTEVPTAYATTWPNIPAGSPCNFGGPFTTKQGSIGTSIRENAQGAIRQMYKGNVAGAKSLFVTILSQWDGTGFPNLHSGSLRYDTRDYLWALVAAKHLQTCTQNGGVWSCTSLANGLTGNGNTWGPTLQAKVEAAIAQQQDQSVSGGLWATACPNPVPGGGTSGCYPNPNSTNGLGINGDAHNSAESVGLLLLAYKSPIGCLARTDCTF